MSDSWGNDPLKTGTPPATATPAKTDSWGNDPINTGVPSMTIRPTPTPAAAAPTPATPAAVQQQSGDMLAQPHQREGNFYSSATAVPQQFEPMLQQAATKYGVPLGVLHWVGYHESAWNPGAIGIPTSDGPALGMFQFKASTAKELGINPMDPAQSIDGAARYLRHLYDQTGDWTAAVERYGTFSTGMGARRDAMAKAGFRQYAGDQATLPGGPGMGPGRGDDDGYPSEAIREANRGFAEGFGDEPLGLSPRSEEELEDWGIYNKPGENNPLKAINRGIIGPVAAAGDLALRLPSGALRAGQAYVQQQGVNLGVPGLGRDIAAIPESVMGASEEGFMSKTPVERALTAQQQTDRAALQTANQILGYGSTPQGKAARIVGKRANQDVTGGNYYRPETDYDVPPADGGRPTIALPTGPADDVVGNLDRMRASGKPAAPVHVLGTNTQGLAGRVARSPGEGQGIIRRGVAETDAGAAARAQGDVGTHLTQGSSAYRTTVDLMAKRSADANPLYEKAFEGGSIAPLFDQFQDAFNETSKASKQAAADVEAAQSQLNAALSKQPVTGGNVYSTSAANEGVRAARLNLQAAQARRAHAEAMRGMVLDKLRQAQEDIANDTPGAVWNPRIQEFLDLPQVKQGLRSGFDLERMDAVTERRPFNPTEYAMTPDGEVIRVPNMRTLNVAKKGLDQMIAAERDKITGRLSERGVSLANLQREFVKELDAVNPDYKKAREAWAGPSASLDAVNWAKVVDNKDVSAEQVAQEFSDMSEGQKDFARLAVADRLLAKIGDTTFGADEAKNLIKNPNMRDRLQPIFRTQDEFVSYVTAVADERRMYDVATRMLKNSATADRLAEDASGDLSAAAHGVHAVASIAHGNVGRALGSGIRAGRELLRRKDPAVDAEIARILMNPEGGPQVVNGELDFSPPAPPIQTPNGPIYPRQ